MKTYGEKVWLIPDGFISSVSHGIPSHDAICVLNTSDIDAVINLILYFEDKDKMDCFTAECKAGRTHHIRMDKLVGKNGERVPTDSPYAILVESNIEIVVQYSRLDTSQDKMALMTTIAYPINK